MKPPEARRCAVYTRKSSEEGLDQDFNSLHAQREACEAFILSQKSEGWMLIPDAYDDGGYSGGTMERPGLKRLLVDVAAGRVDTIVVYKVDRLTRALSDFARMVEQFDAQGVTFVAVTQQFNTTTSMGRLTLNVLLSFAQFEREVTGERIRDKIAASKAKGMWMGGNVPLGYSAIDRKLVINEQRAASVRRIFQQYLLCGSVKALARQLRRDGVNAYSRGALYHLLSSPVYIGRVRHKGKEYPGQHQPLIDQTIWDRVQALLAGNGGQHTRLPRSRGNSALARKLFDAAGEPFIVAHTAKNGRRYRYYVSRAMHDGETGKGGWRLPAGEIERAVSEGMRSALADRGALVVLAMDRKLPAHLIPVLLAEAGALAARSELAGPQTRSEILRRVEVADTGLKLELDLSTLIGGQAAEIPELVLHRHVPTKLRRRGIELRLVVNPDSHKGGDIDRTLLQVIARARGWFEELTAGSTSTIKAIAARDGVTGSYVGQLLPLACLAPAIVEAITEGRQPADLTARDLIFKYEIPPRWTDQVSEFLQ